MSVAAPLVSRAKIVRLIGKVGGRRWRGMHSTRRGKQSVALDRAGIPAFRDAAQDLRAYRTLANPLRSHRPRRQPRGLRLPGAAALRFADAYQVPLPPVRSR